MASASSYTLLPELESANFNNWKFHAIALLEEKQTAIALEKEEGDYTDVEEKDEFKLKDLKAKSTIVFPLNILTY